MGDLLHFSTGPRRGCRRGTSATAWYAIGCAASAESGGDPGRAIAAYERAIAGRPDFADAYNNLGRLLHERGEAAIAESCYRLAVCADATIALYWFNLGVALEDQGRVSESIGAYDAAIALDDALADAHWNVARLHELVGRKSNDELALHRAFRHLGRYRRLAAGTH